MAEGAVAVDVATKSGAQASFQNEAWANFSGFSVNYGNGNSAGAASGLPWWLWPVLAGAALLAFKKMKGR
ncbi:hypothetical protein [Aquabacterium sp.]|uniref:hypothetical protein n=1 Tax=Aquabacterium sp. TaxID=1872578 RepID=UPI0025BF96A9|nr:hypothetical protein [Aquabacterium sp.]